MAGIEGTGWKSGPAYSVVRSREETIQYHQDAYENGLGRMLAPIYHEDGTPEPDDNNLPNKYRQIINSHAAMLVGDGRNLFKLDDPRAQQAYDELATLKNHPAEIVKIATSGGIAGHCWVTVEDGWDGQPEINLHDPADVDVVTHEDNMKHVLYYVRTWKPAGDVETTALKRMRYIPTLVNGTLMWEIVTEEAGPGDSWLELDRTDWPLDAPHPPMIEWQNAPLAHQYHGMPDVSDDDFEQCRIYAALLSNLTRNVRRSTNPFVYGHIGRDPNLDQLNKGIRSKVSQALGREPEKKPLSVNTNEVFVSTDAGVKFEALKLGGDIDAGLDVLSKTEADLYQSTATALVTSERALGMGAMSGVALQQLYRDQIMKCLQKRNNYEAGFTRILQGVMWLLGYELALNEITVVWPDPVPVDQLERAQLALALINLGYSRDTAIRMTGGDPDHEREMKTQEEDESDKAAAALIDQLTRGNLDRNGGNEAGTVDED